MTAINITALSMIGLFVTLMIGPVLGMPLVGDIYLHAALLFEAVPAALIAGFFASVAEEIYRG